MQIKNLRYSRVQLCATVLRWERFCDRGEAACAKRMVVQSAVNHFVKDFWRKKRRKIALMVGNIMNRALHQRAEEIFCSAFEIESLSDRKAFLDRECQTDPELRGLVDGMLALQPRLDQLFPEGGVPFNPREL